MAKSAIMTTAYQDVREGRRCQPADPFDMGAGHVDPGERPTRARHSSRVSRTTPGCSSTSHSCVALSLRRLHCEHLRVPRVIGVPTDPSDLNLPSIGIAELPGSQTVRAR